MGHEGRPGSWVMLYRAWMCVLPFPNELGKSLCEPEEHSFLSPRIDLSMQHYYTGDATRVTVSSVHTRVGTTILFRANETWYPARSFHVRSSSALLPLPTNSDFDCFLSGVRVHGSNKVRHPLEQLI
jgi:hypothetical protein